MSSSNNATVFEAIDQLGTRCLLDFRSPCLGLLCDCAWQSEVARLGAT